MTQAVVATPVAGASGAPGNMNGGPDPYVGRFAPSPTGPLHFGSLLTAVASYAQARANGGKWLVRIEDIDPGRAQKDAPAHILNTLRECGFEWDEPPAYQSSFHTRHRQVIQQLADEGLSYECTCSRRDLTAAPRGPLGTVYPGSCRNGCLSGPSATRIRTHNAPIEFVDYLQGHWSQRLETDSGDFIIRRRDDLIAYHLAVVVDDCDQGITEVVRGIDLIDSTPRQIYLQQRLGMKTPAYAHVAVAVNDDGQKLSKATGATALSADGASENLFLALQALKQNPPQELSRKKPADIWRWTISNWDMKVLAGVKSIDAEAYGYG